MMIDFGFIITKILYKPQFTLSLSNNFYDTYFVRVKLMLMQRFSL